MGHGTDVNPQKEDGTGVVDIACSRECIVGVESPTWRQSRRKLIRKVKPIAHNGKGFAERLHRRTLKDPPAGPGVSDLSEDESCTSGRSSTLCR